MSSAATSQHAPTATPDLLRFDLLLRMLVLHPASHDLIPRLRAPPVRPQAHQIKASAGPKALRTGMRSCRREENREAGATRNPQPASPETAIEKWGGGAPSRRTPPAPKHQGQYRREERKLQNKKVR